MKKHFTSSILILALAATSFFVQSCTGSNENNNENTTSTPDTTAKAAPWQLTFEDHSATEKDCPVDDCTYIRLHIPILAGNHTDVAETVNTFTKNEVRETVKSRLPEPRGNISLEAMCDAFMEGYQLFKIEFPDSDARWYLDISGDSSVVGEDYFTTVVQISEYLGGAHPNTYTQIHSFDLQSGNQIRIADRFDINLVKSYAEKRFREKNKLSPDDRLDDNGFLFEDGVFVLPENMGLTPEGLLLYYNAYEVAAYANGPTRIVIPYNLITPAI